jgi:hypothetical protein
MPPGAACFAPNPAVIYADDLRKAWSFPTRGWILKVLSAPQVTHHQLQQLFAAQPDVVIPRCTVEDVAFEALDARYVRKFVRATVWISARKERLKS